MLFSSAYSRQPHLSLAELPKNGLYSSHRIDNSTLPDEKATIHGFWTTMNEKTKQPESIVAIYCYKNRTYGRMIGTYEKGSNKIVDTIYHPIDRAPGIANHPYYSGLDFIYDLKKEGSRYKGKIVDPEKGNVYNAELWTENSDLIVRGKILFFGRNQTWKPFPESSFSKQFPQPDVSQFVPIIPIVID